EDGRGARAHRVLRRPCRERGGGPPRGPAGLPGRRARRHPSRVAVNELWKFTKTVLKAFKANQGMLLAGAVAYYALLSIVPLLILMVIALSHFIDATELLATISRYLEWVVPGQGAAVVRELSAFLEHRDLVGWVLVATMIFFSSLAFTVLENAMS